MLRIVYDIRYGGVDGGAVFKGDEADLLQEQEGAAAIGRIVRNGNLSAVGDFADVFIFVGVSFMPWFLTTLSR